MANTVLIAQTMNTTYPLFEIVKVQDGTENGKDVVFSVRLTDENGRPLVNTSNEDIAVAIEFGVDSDVERNDIETVFPTSIAIKKGTGSTLITLKVLNDQIHETTESLVAMIYDPSVGKISDADSYAQASITDNDDVPMATNAAVTAETAMSAKENSTNSPTITMLNK